MKPALALRTPLTATALMLAAQFAVSLQAGVNDLRITEVNPATGQVEVTHIGTTQFTTTSSLPFCHLFNYASGIPIGTAFGAGESKVFTVSGLNSSASDLWLYLDSNFPNPGSIITGLKYGSSASLGRTSVAVAAGIWPSTSAFVPLPSSNQSLQPVTIEATRTTNWFSGTPNFGSFSPVQIQILRLTDTGSVFVLEFSSPLSATAHRLESRTSLSLDATWTESSPTVSSNAPNQFQITIPKSTNTNEFFRIKGL
jgi:hypothetical protein